MLINQTCRRCSPASSRHGSLPRLTQLAATTQIPFFFRQRRPFVFTRALPHGFGQRVSAASQCISELSPESEVLRRVLPAFLTPQTPTLTVFSPYIYSAIRPSCNGISPLELWVFRVRQFRVFESF